MSFFDRIFKPSEPENIGPDISFGRYTDSHKSREQYEALESSTRLFEEGKFLESYRVFMKYLYDKEEENIQWEEEKGIIRFKLYQGSRQVTGQASRLGVKASAKIARATVLKSSFARRMLELNFDLKYGRYALSPDNEITIVFDSAASDGSPYKLYYALKELATSADKQDDLLLDEFKQLEEVENNHLTPISESEKEVKYEFLCRKIDEAFAIMDAGELDLRTYPGAFSYLLLDLCYKLDYLIKPEGFMMETLERINRIYFSNTAQNSLQKILMLRQELETLRDRPKEEYFKEMYRVKTSFGITSPIDQQKVRSIIEGELGNMDWYRENGHPRIALAIPSYIVGYCLFTYAIPRPIQDYFHLFHHIMEETYFHTLGFTSNYCNVKDADKMNKKAIKKRIKAITERYEDIFPRLAPKTNVLDFTDRVAFARSYLLMIHQLDLLQGR